MSQATTAKHMTLKGQYEAIPSTSPIGELESHILGLLHPFRDELFGREPKNEELCMKKDRKALVLCKNIVFLVRNKKYANGEHIDPESILIASRNWEPMQRGETSATVGIFIQGHGFQNDLLVRVNVLKGDSVVGAMAAEIDKQLSFLWM
ncbi:hypothetical protein T440DRAFT_554382 [Plenodomus tracheiphilus IPT5]|uniref:Uncharacterized protein n=1 Tax=Plenodomus tracheiphilus IPT5 TaxID=1408161 RepID=A0A6A7BAM5_9PLEO|nr:hypothetical protein T440DRAFT_554382 [Plenodomus tracheiphilus IPT5]